METGKLKTFAQAARRQLLEDVGTRLEQVLRADSVETREKKDAIAELKQQIAQSSKQAVIDRVAYTWFNRTCALRFMDVNRYTRLGIVSPMEGFTQPEILQEAKQGVIDDEFKVDPQRVLDILSGKTPSSDPQGEAYRLLLVGACNAYHQLMPFLFEPIADYTELLMPDDLLSENSVVHKLRQVLTAETCQDVEVIGWLYQFYISERKDEVFENLKKNIKIEAKDIPAATQLFTPHWIVRYLVENSLGRLWMLNHPSSMLIEQMEYYIKPEQEETDFLKIESPEEFKVCDPACGSGHMLTYAFDLLYAIYEEQGYDPIQIPSLILKKNLYGIEIDKRAGDLAAFALVMKARTKDRRFFSRGVEPNICVLQNVTFTDKELDEYMDALGRDLFTEPLRMTLHQFEQADNFGSLIQPVLKNVTFIRERFEEKGVFANLFLHNTNRKVQLVLNQLEYLLSKYQIVVANPPYMGGQGINDELKEFVNNVYPDSKSDLFATFIERGFELVGPNGYNAMVTMQSWMFLSSFETLRERLSNQTTIICMVHMANMVMGIAFGTAATVWKKAISPNFRGYFSYVDYEDLTKNNVPFEFPVKNERQSTASFTDFKKIPGSPIAYWVSENIRESFSKFPTFATYAETRIGLITGDNENYIRNWHEVTFSKIGFGLSREGAKRSRKKWFPQSKGGSYRKWYGNQDTILDWSNDGHELQTRMHSSGLRTLAHNFNLDKIFHSGITWTKITSGNFTARIQPQGFLFNDASANAFPKIEEYIYPLLGFLTSKLPPIMLDAINPTLNFLPGNISALPLAPSVIENYEINRLVKNITVVLHF